MLSVHYLQLHLIYRVLNNRVEAFLYPGMESFERFGADPLGPG